MQILLHCEYCSLYYDTNLESWLFVGSGGKHILSISLYLQLYAFILCIDATAHFEADLSGVSEGSNPSQVPPLGVDIPFTDRGLFIGDLALSLSSLFMQSA